MGSCSEGAVVMGKQKFKKGDLVQVADDLGPMMSHFTSGCRAIVIERSGGDYGLFLEGHGECWWYHTEQLTLIKKNSMALLKKWEKAEQDEDELKGSLDWIFEHGKQVIEYTHGASVATLAKNLGCHNLWGNNGEGMTYYANSMAVMQMAKPFLETGDKDSWLSFAKEFIKEKNCG